MRNAVWNSIEEYNDISTIDQYHIARDAGLSDAEALEVCGKMSRDNARTPMQWNTKAHAGFTTGTPWLKVNSNYTEINMESQENDPESVLNYYRKLIAVRKSLEYKDVFTYGEFVPAYQDTETVMAYYRQKDTKKILVASNFGQTPVDIPLESAIKRIILSNKNHAEVPSHTLHLDSCEVIVLECAQ